MTDDDYARRIALHFWAVRDVLDTAIRISGRGSDGFGGTVGAILFDDLQKAIADLDRHPAMVAVRAASIPPSMLRGGKK